MIKNILIQIFSLGYLLLLVGVFSKKRKEKTLENSVYQVFLILTFIVILLDGCSNYLMFFEKYKLLNIIISKSYIVSTIIWSMWLIIYVSSLKKDNIKSLKELIKSSAFYYILFIITFILGAICIYLKSSYYVDINNYINYQNGKDLYFSFIINIIYNGILGIYLISSNKNIEFNKKITILLFIFLNLISIVLQWVFKDISITSSIMAFVMTLIYYTMENPDLKIITELEKDKEEANEASKAKTDFLSNMSHDIRTPMNAIIGFSESLLTEELPENQKNEVQSIYDAASTLLEIINNVLDVSRIESGKEEKRETTYDIRKVIMQLTSVITSKVDKSKVNFNVNIEKDVPKFLIGDELKIYQILMNLLSNAVKYTDIGHIDFIIKSDNVGDMATLNFIISDTGIGIKESDYDKLFVKFSRINNQENYKSIEGTGLGLVITKKLVELLGGTISFTSKYKEGTTFTVILPQKIDFNAIENEEVKTQNKVSTSNVHFDGSLYDILIVDDNELNLKVAQRILSDYKFHITCTQSGEEAINKIKDGARYDLIFLDHMMPIMDGIQTLRIIKNLEGVKIPPVIALTANAMVGMKEYYLKEGFDGYISKPINREELQDLLNNIFCKR
ncbi:MAG: ATP-binding protein [Bacilli bacterium]